MHTGLATEVELLGLIVTRNFPTTNLMISALVAYLGANDAGPGFYKLAKKLGLLSSNASRNERWEFWVTEVGIVHDYYAGGIAVRRPTRA